jgi:cytochrome c-type biogenesis protein
MLSLSGASFVKAILDDAVDFKIVLGSFTILMGIFMLYSALNRTKKACSTSNPTLLEKLSSTKAGLFGIGILISINPCSALMSLVAFSANSISFANAASMGISFGIGAVLVPFLFYGFFLSTLIRGLLIEFKSYAKAIEIAASLLLVTVGIILLNSNITL